MPCLVWLLLQYMLARVAVAASAAAAAHAAPGDSAATRATKLAVSRNASMDAEVRPWLTQSSLVAHALSSV